MPIIEDSKHLAEVEWEGGILYITFRSGDRYQYIDVPIGVYQELLGASSKSLYFRENIKNQYQYSRA